MAFPSIPPNIGTPPLGADIGGGGEGGGGGGGGYGTSSASCDCVSFVRCWGFVEIACETSFWGKKTCTLRSVDGAPYPGPNFPKDMDDIIYPEQAPLSGTQESVCYDLSCGSHAPTEPIGVGFPNEIVDYWTFPIPVPGEGDPRSNYRLPFLPHHNDPGGPWRMKYSKEGAQFPPLPEMAWVWISYGVAKVMPCCKCDSENGPITELEFSVSFESHAKNAMKKLQDLIESMLPHKPCPCAAD